MRHVWSLLAGVVAAPLAWLLLAAGQHRSEETVGGWSDAGFFDTAELIVPALFLLAAGVLLGLLGTLRWSPAGPLAAGALLLAPAVAMFINPFWTADRVGEQWPLLGQDLAPRLPIVNGTLLVLGALLLMAVFSASRWRRWPAAETAASAPGDAETAPAGVGDDTGSGPHDDAPAASTGTETSDHPVEAGAPGKPA